MPETNPLFKFIEQEQTPTAIRKQNILGENYYIIPLHDIPSGQHHLSVYKNINEEVGYNSVYHYTFTTDNESIHIYADENNKILGADSEDFNTHIFTGFYKLPFEKQEEINNLFEQSALPIIQDIHEKHNIKSQGMVREYKIALESLHERLYNFSEEINTNLAIIQHTILLGETTQEICFKKKFITKTLDYLKKCQENFSLCPQHTIVAEKNSSISVQNIEPPSHDQYTLASEHKRSPKIVRNIRDPKLDKMSLEFTKIYTDFTQTLNGFRACQIENFAEKMRLLELMNDNIRIIIGLSFEIQKNQIYFKNNQALLNKTSLGLDLILQTIQEISTSMLEYCISSETLLEAFGDKLKTYTTAISKTYIIDALHNNTVKALSFLLDNTKIDINNFLVANNDEAEPYLSLISTAYKNQQLEIFTLLLQKGALGLGVYNGLPLAHTLLQLPKSDLFSMAYYQYCKPILNGNSTFYKRLAAAIKLKSQDPSLDLEKKNVLENAYADYITVSENNAGLVINYSQQMRNDLITIQTNSNQELMLECQRCPAYKNLIKTLDKKSQELFKLQQKNRTSRKTIRDSENYHHKIASYLDGNCIDITRNFTKEQYIEVLEHTINKIEAEITIITYENKNILTKNERKLYKSALNTLEKATKRESAAMTSLEMNKLGSEIFLSGINSLEQMLDCSDEYGDILSAKESSSYTKMFSWFDRALPIKDPSTKEKMKKIQSKLKSIANSSSDTKTITEEDAKVDDKFTGINCLATALEEIIASAAKVDDEVIQDEDSDSKLSIKCSRNSPG